MLTNLRADTTWMCFVATLVYFSRRIATYVIMLENTTYFFNSTSAFFWALFPVYMSCTGDIPLNYDAAMLTFGGLWVEVWTWKILLTIKSWAPLDNGRKPPEAALLRAQQMYFLAAPLHIYALIAGSQSGCGVRCLKRDQSFWSSFQNSTSLVVAKVWALLLTSSLVMAIIWAFVNFFVTGGNVVLFIGLVMSLVLLSLIWEPVAGMFCHKQLTEYKLRNHEKSFWVRLSKAVCGQHMLLTPKHIYVFLWLLLFILVLQEGNNNRGVFSSAWVPHSTQKHWKKNLGMDD